MTEPTRPLKIVDILGAVTTDEGATAIIAIIDEGGQAHLLNLTYHALGRTLLEVERVANEAVTEQMRQGHILAGVDGLVVPSLFSFRSFCLGNVGQAGARVGVLHMQILPPDGHPLVTIAGSGDRATLEAAAAELNEVIQELRQREQQLN